MARTSELKRQLTVPQTSLASINSMNSCLLRSKRPHVELISVQCLLSDDIFCCHLFCFRSILKYPTSPTCTLRHHLMCEEILCRLCVDSFWCQCKQNPAEVYCSENWPLFVSRVPGEDLVVEYA